MARIKGFGAQDREQAHDLAALEVADDDPVDKFPGAATIQRREGFDFGESQIMLVPELQQFDKEDVLTGEMVQYARLRQAAGVRDLLDGDSVESTLGEKPRGGRENLYASGLSRQPSAPGPSHWHRLSGRARSVLIALAYLAARRY